MAMVTWDQGTSVVTWVPGKGHMGTMPELHGHRGPAGNAAAALALQGSCDGDIPDMCGPVSSSNRKQSLPSVGALHSRSLPAEQESLL